MRVLSLLTLAALTSYAAAEYFVVQGPVHYAKAAETCAKHGGKWARIRPDERKKRAEGTKALHRGLVTQAFVRPPFKSLKRFPHVLRKPGDYKTSKQKGKVLRLECDADKICTLPFAFGAVLCHAPGKRDPNRKLDRFGGYKKKTHRKKGYYDSSYRDDSYDYVEEVGCEGDSCPEMEREYSRTFETSYEPPRAKYIESEVGGDYY